MEPIFSPFSRRWPIAAISSADFLSRFFGSAASPFFFRFGAAAAASALAATISAMRSSVSAGAAGGAAASSSSLSSRSPKSWACNFSSSSMLLELRADAAESAERRVLC